MIAAQTIELGQPRRGLELAGPEPQHAEHAAQLIQRVPAGILRRLDPSPDRIYRSGVALYGTIPVQHLFNDGTLPTPAVSRAMLGAGYATGFVVAPLAFGLMILAVSLLGLRHGTLPRWLAIAGFPLAAVQLASLLFFPAWLIVLWSLVTSVTLIIRTTRPSIPEPHGTAHRRPRRRPSGHRGSPEAIYIAAGGARSQPVPGGHGSVGWPP